MRRNQQDYPIRRGDFGMERSGFGPLFGGSPWQAMRRMQEDMDHLFTQIFSGEDGERTLGTTGTMQQWTPRTDISSTDKEWCIEAEIPGVDKDDIHVTLRDHHLIVRAEMKRESSAEQEERQFVRRERQYGFFERVIPLPDNANEEQIACDFRNGVLTIHVPRTAQAAQQGRRIPVMDAARIPAETATGRNRSQAELEMTEDEEHEEHHEVAGRR
jgi:HSP20 family protein